MEYRTRRAVLGAVTLFLAGCTSATKKFDGEKTQSDLVSLDESWPQSRGNAKKTAYSQNSIASEAHQRRWQADVGTHPNGASMIGDGQIVASTIGDGISLVNGHGEVMDTEYVGLTATTTPAIVGQDFVVSAYDEAVYRISSEESSVQWKSQIDGRPSPVTVTEDLNSAIVGTSKGELTGIRAEDGYHQWNINIDDPIKASPAVFDGRAYVGGYNSGITAVSIENGEELWSVDTAGCIGPVAVDNNNETTIIAAGRDKILRGICAINGDVQWERPVGKHLTPPAIVDGTVFIGAETRVESFDVSSGNREWRVDLEDVVTPPVVTSESAVVAAGNEVVAINHKGEVDLTIGRTKSPPITHPVVLPEGILIGTEDGYLVAYISS
ncbi:MULTISPECIES: outer membrane protein assembly factor BamB family protein [Haloarcula]|uniref:outer membrane protein assembly factor BamB family protein n=1 Tax=Haloarcula TaxID=2237 RepID=UPI0009B5B367|nr:PQQ-binding-like beta-propeller repeat protein [Haloarcula amylolytica]